MHAARQSAMQCTVDKHSTLCRAAEEELCSVAEERDRLLPQLEELRWRNRQADRELAQLQEAAEATQQVCPSTAHFNA